MADNVRKRRKRKPVDADKLLQRSLHVLDGIVSSVEKSPETLMLVKGGVDSMVKVTNCLRQINSDLNLPKFLRKLEKLTDAELEELERKAAAESGSGGGK